MDVLKSTYAIIFLGTPQQGTGLAQQAGILAKCIGYFKQTNTSILDVLRRNSEVLAQIQHDFHELLEATDSGGDKKLYPIRITCCYEQLPLPCMGLVSGISIAFVPLIFQL